MAGHVDARNDDLLATEGAVEVAGSEPPCYGCRFWRWYLARGRAQLAETVAMYDEAAELFDGFEQEDDDDTGASSAD